MNTVTAYYVRQMTAWLIGVAIALVFACASAAQVREVNVPGRRAIVFNDPPTPQQRSQAGTTAANLILYNSLCAPIPQATGEFVVELVDVAGGQVHVEVFVGAATRFAASNGVPAFCAFVRSQVPAELLR